MKKDWTGNKTSIFSTLGSSNHSNVIRPNLDFYATEPKAVELLLEKELFDSYILEPCCGLGHITKVLKKHNYDVTEFDIIQRNDCKVLDFLSTDFNYWHGDIITNPPYKNALEFVKKSLSIIQEGKKVAMFLKLQFLEGKERRKFFDQYPPKIVYVSSSRLKCGLNGDFNSITSSAVCYAWFIWQKGNYSETKIKWIN